MPPEWLQRFQGIVGNFTERMAARGQELLNAGPTFDEMRDALPEGPPQLQALADFLSSDAVMTAADFAMPQVGAVRNVGSAVAPLAKSITSKLPREELARYTRKYAMGFDIPAYHWTPAFKDFDQFAPWSHFGTPKAAIDRGNWMRSGPLSWRATGPERMLEHERTYPVLLRGKYWQTDDHGTWPPFSLADELLRKPFTDDLGALDLDMLHDIARNRIAYTGDRYAHNRIQEMMEAAGYAGLRYSNQAEDFGSTSYLVFDPLNSVRSPYAKFLSERGDLLAGIAGAAFVGASESQR